MFGMGFFEILLIAVIAIIALGPEKLPNAMIEVARFLKKFKSGVEDAKSTLDNELNIAEMKEEASKFKAQIDNAKSTVSMNNVDLGLNSIINDDMSAKPSTQEEPKLEEPKAENENQPEEKVSFKKKKEDKPEEKKANKANKFKVNQDGDSE